MVWVANVRPAIGAALGHSAAAMTGIPDAVLPTASAELVAAANSAQSQKAVAKPKKAQRSANRQNAGRDQYRNVAPFWREVRVDDWAARGYAPRERDYQRSAYGRGGFTPNFW